MRTPFIPVKRHYPPGNYRIALELSRQKLASSDPAVMAFNSGCTYNADSSSFQVQCLGHPFTVTFPDGMVKYDNTDMEPPIAIQLVMLNYLSRSDGTPLSYKYVSYRALDGGNVFYDAFNKTAINPLAMAFGSNPAQLLAAGALFGGTPVPRGTGTGILLFFLPRVPILFQVWPGDEEFPASANILFDSTANHYLHTEDLAAMDIVTRLLIKYK
jgi:hypothetical protein